MVEDMKDKKFAEELIEKLKDLVRKGNVTKIQVLKGGEVIVNFPLNVGIVAGVAIVLPTGTVDFMSLLSSFGDGLPYRCAEG